jgi:hypothetical protein
MPMMRFIVLLPVLLVLFVIGLGLYALIVGEINLIRGSIRGPLARLLGVLLIVSAIVFIPILLRGLVGLGMNLGH